jgi:hypothetical protein
MKPDAFTLHRPVQGSLMAQDALPSVLASRDGLFNKTLLRLCKADTSIA